MQCAITSLLCHVHLCPILLSLCLHCPQKQTYYSFLIIPPPSLSLQPHCSALSLTFCSIACPCSPSTFLLSLPSLLLLLLPLRSRFTLIPPRSHTQAASSPLHFYLHTHLSPLLSPPSSPSPTNTNHPSVVSPSLHSLFHLFQFLPPSHALSLAVFR